MNDEQSKRMADAADSLMQASDALNEARDAVNDPRFERELDRERLAAALQMGQKVDAAAKRLEDAIRKGTIAAAANSRPGAWAHYREAISKVREGRAKAKSALESDGVPARRAAAGEGVALMDQGLALTARIVFGE